MRVLTALPFAILVLLSGCNAYVEKSKYDALQKELSSVTAKLSESQEALRKANEEAAKTKPGRYQNFSQGFRQWRLDTATGSSCILLASSADWKDPNITRQGCECEDQEKAVEAATTESARKINSAFLNDMGCLDFLKKKQISK